MQSSLGFVIAFRREGRTEFRVQPIEIPAPVAGDSESVATALETAAVFAAKGDSAEALRWVKRAAESASEDGDDARILTLARTAAALSDRMQESAQAAPANGAVTQGAPPNGAATQGASGNGAATSARPDGAATSTPLPTRGSEPASEAGSTGSEPPRRWLPKPPPRTSSVAPSPAAESASVRPPPPSARASSTPLPPSARASTTPRPPSVRPTTNGATSATSMSARPASARPGTNGEAPANGASTSPVPLNVRPVKSVVVTPSAQPPMTTASSSVRPSNGLSRSAKAAATGVSSSAATVVRSDAATGHRLRSAARVSVVASATEPGLYLVRLLEEGAAAPPDAAEAFLVLVDPTSSLLSH